MIESSYGVNNYGEVFRAIVDAFKPINVVELGVLNGYSTFHIAAALQRNGRGEIKAYDLFEDYPFRHAKFQDVVEFFKPYANVEIRRADAYMVAETYPDHSVDLLHIDISNNGDTVKKMMEQWDRKMVHGGVILFEGGSEERDNIEWMVKYGFPKMKPEIETNPIIQEKYVYATYLKYPSLTMLLKKR